MSSLSSVQPDSLPLRPRANRRRRRSSFGLALRLLAAAAFVAGGAALIYFEFDFRRLETVINAFLMRSTFASSAISLILPGNDPSILYTYLGRGFVLRVTEECSIALYIGPIAIFGGLLTLVRRLRLRRIALATGIALVGMALLNQFRILALGFVFGTWGHDAFEWAHSLGGSFLMLFGLAACLAVFFRIVVIGAKRSDRKATIKAGR
ncbi:exosortase R [Frondihabitans australicus]|uniref:Exosortase/archaeosortase family protein n=1 Tax=Frondihabitans australicus TaxID=386892 RepID=A0A495IHW3_9MICO|nr:exosortase R [Frondihabitans australicus]RKR74705.1 exosortase/archaeosortase family protein [Frondihabitans australicus]